LITALDTSVLLDVLAAEPKYVARSQKALRTAVHEGAIVSCPIVWAELRPFFPDRSSMLKAVETLGLVYSPITEFASLLAGEIFKKYTSSGGRRGRMIPDFIIAAHAADAADRLLTRDRGFYIKYFPKLTVMSP